MNAHFSRIFLWTGKNRLMAKKRCRKRPVYRRLQNPFFKIFKLWIRQSTFFRVWKKSKLSHPTKFFFPKIEKLQTPRARTFFFWKSKNLNSSRWPFMFFFKGEKSPTLLIIFCFFSKCLVRESMFMRVSEPRFLVLEGFFRMTEFFGKKLSSHDNFACGGLAWIRTRDLPGPLPIELRARDERSLACQKREKDKQGINDQLT